MCLLLLLLSVAWVGVFLHLSLLTPRSLTLYLRLNNLFSQRIKHGLELLLWDFSLPRMRCLGSLFLTNSSLNLSECRKKTCVLCDHSLWVYFLLGVAHSFSESPLLLLSPEFAPLFFPSILLGCFHHSCSWKCNLIFVIQGRQNWVNLIYPLSPNCSWVVIGLYFVMN